MKKIFLCLLCIALFASLAACKTDEGISTIRVPSTTVHADKTEPLPTEAAPLSDIFSFLDYLQWLEDYAQQEGFLGVKNLTESGEEDKPDLIRYIFDYDENLVHVNVSTKNGTVAHIYSTVSPYTIIDLGVSSDMTDAQMIAYSLALEPIVGINSVWDHSWHLQQFIDAQEQGDGTSIKRSYTCENWKFTVVIGDALVSVSALNNHVS